MVADIGNRTGDDRRKGKPALWKHPKNWTEMVFDKLPDTVEEIFPIKAIYHGGKISWTGDV